MIAFIFTYYLIVKTSSISKLPILLLSTSSSQQVYSNPIDPSNYLPNYKNNNPLLWLIRHVDYNKYNNIGSRSSLIPKTKLKIPDQIQTFSSLIVYIARLLPNDISQYIDLKTSIVNFHKIGANVVSSYNINILYLNTLTKLFMLSW